MKKYPLTYYKFTLGFFTGIFVQLMIERLFR